jgi:tetratricopeptide (TPR) repeat protein
LFPAFAFGQAAPQTQSFLVLAPVPKNAGDSAYATQLGDAMRKKVDGKLRLKLRVITKENITKALESSGFPPNAILDENGASQLARFMNVDSYMTGRVDKGAGTLSLRLVDNRRSGMSGWINIKGAPEQIVDMVGDSVDQQVKAAEQTRECLERRDKQEYGSAKERADRAFRLYPNHPATAMCVSSIYDAMKAPADSQIAILKKAVTGDSLLTRAWDGLVRQYQAKGDTAAWADAVIHSLSIDPTDMRKRLAATELLFRLKRNQQAAELVDEGLERAPGDPQATAMKLRICFEGQMWACAVQGMAAKYESDSAVRSDSLYLRQLLAAAQATNDPAKIQNYSQLSDKGKKYYQLTPDTAAVLKWTGVAVQRFPQSVSFWKARATALKDAGKTDEANAAYQKIAELDTKDIPSRIAMVQTLTAKVKIDSTAPLDTATLNQIDQILSQVGSTSTDDNVKMNVAVMYFQPASKMVQNKVGLDKAIDWMDKVKTYDTKKQLTAQANFFQGLAYVFGMGGKFDLKALQASKDCKQLVALREYVGKARAAMTAGASVQQATADQVLKSISGIEDFIPKAKTAWKCPG